MKKKIKPTKVTIKITGKVGNGKTTIARYIASHLYVGNEYTEVQIKHKGKIYSGANINYSHRLHLQAPVKITIIDSNK